MIVVRHGLMLVGPTGGGKSSNLHVLEETLSQLKQMGQEVNTAQSPKKKTQTLGPVSWLIMYADWIFVACVANYPT